eukprot:8860360-Pyramimonas_sp.AAC.1
MAPRSPKAVQQLESASSGWAKFREWGEQLSNALAHVKRVYRNALKSLSSKLGTMDRALPSDED